MAPSPRDRPTRETTESVTYQFDMDRSEWREWTETVPRNDPLHERLRELIRLDTALAMEEFDVAQLRLVDLKADRILEKARQGQNAIEKREKPHQAVEKLQGIEEIADSLTVGVGGE